MPKKPNISVEYIADIIDAVDDLMHEINNINDEIQVGRVDDLPDVTDWAIKAAHLARHSATLSASLLLAEKMQKLSRV